MLYFAASFTLLIACSAANAGAPPLAPPDSLALLQKHAGLASVPVESDHQDCGKVDCHLNRAHHNAEHLQLAEINSARKKVSASDFPPPNDDDAIDGVPESAMPEQFDLCNADLVMNNLGGLGPDVGPGNIHFKGVVHDKSVDLVISNVSIYNPWKPSANGVPSEHDCFGQVGLKCGSEVTLRFSFVDAATGLPRRMSSFYFTILDLDEGLFGRCRESVEVSGYTSFSLPPTSTVRESIHDGSVRFSAQEHGTAVDNPTAVLADELAKPALTDVQERHAISFFFKDVQSFSLTFNTDTDQAAFSTDLNVTGYAGRKILFAGMTAGTRTLSPTAAPTEPPATSTNSPAAPPASVLR